VACAVFFARDGVAREEALDRAEAEDEALLRQARADFLDRGVPAWAERGHHRIVVRLDLARTPVAAKPPGARIALFTLPLAPAADARRAHSKTFGGLAMRRACRHSPQNPNPKIDRQRSRHPLPASSGRQSDSLRA